MNRRKGRSKRKGHMNKSSEHRGEKEEVALQKKKKTM